MENLQFITSDSPLWDALWSRLFEIYGEREDTDNGEQWQYMGTVTRGIDVHHEFRHRSYAHRGAKCRVYVSLYYDPCFGEYRSRDKITAYNN